MLALAKKANQEGSNLVCDEEVYKEPVEMGLDVNIEDLCRICFDYFTKTLNQDWTYKIEKNVPGTPERYFKRLVNSVNLVLNSDYNPLKRHIVQPEQDFVLDVKEDWANYDYQYFGERLKGTLGIRGIIDLITKDGEFIEVIDWKDGRRFNWTTGEEKTYAKLMKDPQLLIYYYAIRKLYPDVKNLIITIFFINDGGPFTLCFTDSDFVKVEKMVKEKFEKVKSTTIPRLNKSYRCKLFCHFGKNSFPGSSKTICQDIEKDVRTKGMENTVLNRTNGDYRIKGTSPK